MTTRGCPGLSSAASRLRTHPAYVNRFGALCPEKSTEAPELLQNICLRFSAVPQHGRASRSRGEFPIRRKPPLGFFSCFTDSPQLSCKFCLLRLIQITNFV